MNSRLFTAIACFVGIGFSTQTAQAQTTASITFSSVIDVKDRFGGYLETIYQAQIDYSPANGRKIVSVKLELYENDGKNGKKPNSKVVDSVSYGVNSNPAVNPGGGTLLAVIVTTKGQVADNLVMQATATDDTGNSVTSTVVLPTTAVKQKK